MKNGEVTIGNEYLERKFSTSDNKLATTELDNKRADLTFTPAQVPKNSLSNFARMVQQNWMESWIAQTGQLQQAISTIMK